MAAKNLPLILLGGGGYTIENVARCWAYETGRVVGMDCEGQIPAHDEFISHYQEGSTLHFDIKN
jgi:histone deacetylase 1/2